MFLTEAQQRQYAEEGYLVLRQHFSASEMTRLDEAFARNPPLNANMGSLRYPEPGRYTLAKSCFRDADLAYFAEHPDILAGSRELLADDIHLTAFVLYDRTPGGPPIGAHNDYKRWRPVGSSMNWLFTIVPMVDFDEEAGPLYVYPGSHHLERVMDRGERARHVDPSVFPEPESCVDPELKRGDLLFMNMHTWHRAAGNRASHHRTGLFNKYAARHCPPATGYFLFDDEAAAALSPQNRDLIAVHSNRPIAATRLLLERSVADRTEYLLVQQDDRRVFPGGPVSIEEAIPDWDIGNYIEALRGHVRAKLRIELPWVTYVGDYVEADGLCRVYAYNLSGQGFPVPYRDGDWLTAEAIAGAPGFGYESDAITLWRDDSIIRGKGLSQAQSRVDQYAY